MDPFTLPKALVAIAIDGIETLPFLENEAKITYPLIVDEVEETTWQAIRSRVEERSNDNTLVRINLSDGVDAVRSYIAYQKNIYCFILISDCSAKSF
jgi:hypothetical protein